MRQKIRLTESQLHRIIKESVKKVLRENAEENITQVNGKTAGSKLFVVDIWSGGGYALSQFAAYAEHGEDALEKVVAYLDQNGEDYLFQDDTVSRYAQELESEGYDEEEIDNDINATFIYVDATMDGASQPHYIYGENLNIIQK